MQFLIKQKSSIDAHYTHKENGCCRSRAPARESGLSDSFLSIINIVKKLYESFYKIKNDGLGR